MKKRLVSIILVMAILVSYLPLFPSQALVHAEAEVTPDLTISSLEELCAFRDSVNNGNTYEGKVVKLLVDIDLKSIDNWEPIGTNSYWINSTEMGRNAPFCGVFDGNYKTISNLKSKNENELGTAGFFGYLGNDYENKSGATIKNLSILNCYVSSIGDGSSAGGLVGNGYYATITNCHSTGLISEEASFSSAGGLVGIGGYSTITNCDSTVTVSAKGKFATAGGLVGGGYNTTFTNCYATGATSGVGDDSDTGGLVGNGYNSTYTNCHATGAVLGGDDVGGLVGNGYDSTYTN